MSDIYYGGQAVIEGVMMRGSKVAAVAVRNPKGEIVVHEEVLTAAVYTKPRSRWPFARGDHAVGRPVLGTRSLMWSADVSLSDDEEVQFTGPVAGHGCPFVGGGDRALFLPAGSGWQVAGARLGVSPLTGAFIEGLIRLALFLTYLVLIGRMADIRRVFQYHGAEHKTINAYEDGATMTPASVARYSVQHPRCGTSFLLLVLVLSIILFAPLHFNFIEGPLAYVARLGSRLLLIPVVAGISYEFLATQPSTRITDSSRS